jgi:hypothetical protein
MPESGRVPDYWRKRFASMASERCVGAVGGSRCFTPPACPCCKRTHGYGVATQSNAMASRRVDSAGVSLWLDVRNGRSPALLGERKLELCTVVTREGR